MVVGIIITLVFLGMMGVVAVMMMKALKQTAPGGIEAVQTGEESRSHDFLIYDKVEDSVVHLGGDKYRAYIEVGSINYFLRTNAEREVIEMSFQKFLNSLTHPITFFVQTRIIDNTKFLSSLEEDVRNAIVKHPKLEEYAVSYYNEVSGLGTRIGNTREKKKYIIVPYDDVTALSKLSANEKGEYARKEILHRCSMIIEALSSIGLKASVLRDVEIYELIHSTFHRDNYVDYEAIFEGEYEALIVNGEDVKTENLTKDAVLDWILYEAGMRIQNEIGLGTPTSSQIVRELEGLRERFAGYYAGAQKDDNEFEFLISGSGLVAKKESTSNDEIL